MFVHGIGEKRLEALAGESWARKAADRLADWLVDRQPLRREDVEFVRVACRSDCTETLQHLHVAATRHATLVDSWSLVSATWAHEIKPSSLLVFTKWLAAILAAAAVWHTVAAGVRLQRNWDHAARLFRSKQPQKMFWSQFVVLSIVVALVWGVLWRALAMLVILPAAVLTAFVGLFPYARRLVLQVPLLDSHAWLTDEQTEQRITALVRKALVAGANRYEPPRTVLVAHSQGAAVAARTLPRLPRPQWREKPPTLVTLGSGAGLLGMLALAEQDRALRRAGLSMSIAMTLAGLLLLPLVVQLAFDLFRALVIGLWGVGAYTLALSVVSQHPELAHRAVEPVMQRLVEDLEVALTPPGPRFTELWMLSLTGGVLALNVVLVKPAELIARWRQLCRPPAWVQHWFDVHAGHDFVSSSQTLLHRNRNDLYEVGQFASITDHVRYFANEASVLPLVLSAMLRDEHLSATLQSRAAAARRVHRSSIDSAVTLWRLSLILTLLLLSTGATFGAITFAAIGFLVSRRRVKRAHGRVARLVIERPMLLLRQAGDARQRRHSVATEFLLAVSLILAGLSVTAGLGSRSIRATSAVEAALLEQWLTLSGLWLTLALVWLCAWDLVRRATPRSTRLVVLAAVLTCSTAFLLGGSAPLAWLMVTVSVGATLLHVLQVKRSAGSRARPATAPPSPPPVE